jgi:hypothetical protein
MPRGVLILLFVCSGANPSLAAAEPAFRQLRLIAPAAPGGGWDQTARAMQQVLQAEGLAAIVPVENISGAAGTIGLARFVTADAGHPDALLITGLVTVTCALIARRRKDTRPAHSHRPAGPHRRRVGLLASVVALDLLLLEPTGFIVASSALFWLTARAFGSRRPLRDAIVAIGLAAASFLVFARGLGLGQVWIDPQTGEARFAFGIPQLLDGVDVIILVIGLFAVGEIFYLAWTGDGHEEISPVRGSIWMTREEWSRSWKPWLRGTVIGFPLGLLPSGGAEIPTFLSYLAEKRLSPRPEEFGRGAIEGVAGPEAANNAAAAGVLVPLLTLGLPTSATAAVMLAAFRQYGLQPGPLLFTAQPDLVWALVASLYVGNVMLLVLNLPLVGVWVRLLLMPRPLLFGGILVLASLGSYSLSYAQPGTSSILIHVRSAEGAAVPGSAIVVVREGASSDSGIHLDDAPGDALAPALQPGSSRLSLAKAGYQPVATSLDLAPYETLRVRVVLARDGDPTPSRIVVLTSAPSFHGSTFDKELLENLPSGHSPWSVVETADAAAIVDRIDGGGLTTGRPGLLGVNGTSWTQTSYIWNGHDLTRPDVTGLPSVSPDFASLASFSLASARLPVDLRGPGGVMLMNRRSAPTTWSGGVEVGVAPGSAAHKDAPAPAIDRLSGLTELNVHAAGPAFANRLQLAGSATRTHLERLERGGTKKLPAKVTTVNLASVARTVPSHELTMAVAFSDTRREEAQHIDTFRTALAVNLGGRFRIQRRDGGSWSLAGTYQHLTLDAVRPDSNAAAVVDPIRDGPLVDRLPARTRRASAWHVDTNWSGKPRTWSGLVHAWRVGARIGRSRAESIWLIDPLTIGEVVNDHPSRLWTYTSGGRTSLWTSADMSGYIADRATWRDALDLDVGVRLDATKATGITWSTLSPRLQARWHLRDTVDVVGGYARYAHRLPLTDLAFGDPAAPSADVRLWTDRNADGVPQPGEAGTLTARLGPGSGEGSRSSIDANLAGPWTDEILAGLEWNPTPRFRLGLTGLRRRDRHLIASVNAGLLPSDFGVRLLLDPGGDLIDPSDDQRLPVFERRSNSFGHDREILTNPPDHGSFFEALELAIDRRGERWRLLLGATASRTVGPAASRGFGALSNDQSARGDLFLTPNAATFSDGRLFFDRAFTIKVAGTARGPLGLALGAIARYQDGQPFARLVFVDDLAQGPEVVRAVPNGRHRFQYLATLDARLARTFMVLNGTLTISLDAFNLLNEANEVEEQVVSSARFRAVTAVQPPRVVRIGLQLGF